MFSTQVILVVVHAVALHPCHLTYIWTLRRREQSRRSLEVAFHSSGSADLVLSKSDLAYPEGIGCS